MDDASPDAVRASRRRFPSGARGGVGGVREPPRIGARGGGAREGKSGNKGGADSGAGAVAVGETGAGAGEDEREEEGVDPSKGAGRW